MKLKNSQYQTIMRRYDDLQAEARAGQLQRYNQICRILPEYEQIDKDITALCAAQARAVIAGNDVASIHHRLETMEQRKKTLLRDAGYPEDYTEPRYHCPLCKDTGMIGNEKCRCFKQAIADLLYQQSGIHELLKTNNFDTFSLDWYSDRPDPRYGISPRTRMAKIKQDCLDFIEHFDEEDRNLLIYGEPGVGKTFLTHCIAKALLDRYHTVIYLTSSQLRDIMAAAIFDKEDPENSGEDMYRHISDCELLIIDDLGTELNNAFVTSQLFQMINDRLMLHRSTIISTNLSPDELTREYSDRIISRLFSSYETMLILGEDIRLKKALGR